MWERYLVRGAAALVILMSGCKSAESETKEQVYVYNLKKIITLDSLPPGVTAKRSEEGDWFVDPGKPMAVRNTERFDLMYDWHGEYCRGELTEILDDPERKGEYLCHGEMVPSSDRVIRHFVPT